MPLCEQCLSISERQISSGRSVAFHHNSASLKKAVEDKCFACVRIWNSLSREQQAIASQVDFQGLDCYSVSQKKAKVGNEEEPILLHFTFEHGEDLYCDDFNVMGGWRGIAGHFAVLNPNVFNAQDSTVLSACTNDQSCWNQVAEWVGKCCSTHKACRETQASNWAPTRLVDVSGYEQGVVRVVTSSSIPDISKEGYVALSHCWGEQEFLVMHKANRHEFEDGVDLYSLAPNFQDAIFATWKLGMNYLWIDSLCIVQCCGKDWEHEAGMMDKVYRHALLTFAAAASPNAYGGLFASRDPDMVGSCQVTIQCGAEGPLKCTMIHSDLWETEVRRAPLNQRAWVVQERLLAPRTLYFGKNQLFWECRELHACEVLPNGIPSQLVAGITEPDAVDMAPIKSFERALNRLRDAVPYYDESTFWSGGGIPQYESVYEVWNDILKIYASCALTNPNDKLVAISGVAKSFANIVGDGYLAGLWRGNFVNGLLWQVLDPTTAMYRGEEYWPSVRPERYRAPSWSWASVDGPTQGYAFEYELSDHCAEILDIFVDHKGIDPTGELKHACLLVRGRLIKTRRKPTGDNWPGHTQFGKFFPDVENEVEGDYYCLPLRESRSRGPKETGKVTGLVGLVLTVETDGEVEYKSCCGRCSGKLLFTRAGTFEMKAGEPVFLLGMRKPDDWDDWGQESDHLWFPKETPVLEFAII